MKTYNPPYRVFATDHEGNQKLEILVDKKGAAALYNYWRFERRFHDVYITDGDHVIVWPKKKALDSK